MSEKVYLEDIFLTFSDSVFSQPSVIDYKDLSAISSFHSLLADDNEITKSQADFMVRLLKKYSLVMKSLGLDYQHSLKEATWKKDFRILDLSKRAYIEQDSKEGSVICLKFPYAFKKIYEKEFLNLFQGYRHNQWDHNKKINRIPARKINVIYLYELLKSNNFEIDDSFLQVVDTVEEIWQQADDIEPYAYDHDEKIFLKNPCPDAEEFWNANKTGQRNRDLMLAKSMGFIYKPKGNIEDIIGDICSTDSTDFWCASFDKFFKIYKEINDTTVIILDRSDECVNWLEDFVAGADSNQVERSEIKVCFREDKTEASQLNEWIKKNQVGGKIESGKIFIFRNRPAKWLFSEKIDVKLVVTNSLFPLTNHMTQHWLSSKACLIYLGNIKPSQIKERKIVQL